jgi:hypothetical protein
LNNFKFGKTEEVVWQVKPVVAKPVVIVAKPVVEVKPVAAKEMSETRKIIEEFDISRKFTDAEKSSAVGILKGIQKKKSTTDEDCPHDCCGFVLCHYRHEGEMKEVATATLLRSKLDTLEYIVNKVTNGKKYVCPDEIEEICYCVLHDQLEFHNMSWCRDLTCEYDHASRICHHGKKCRKSNCIGRHCN